MKKMFKLSISLLLTIALLMVSVPTSIFMVGAQDAVVTEYFKEDFSYIADGENKVDHYAFYGQTLCGETLTYKKTSNAYGQGVVSVKDQNGNTIKLSSNTEYIISLDYKVNNIGTTEFTDNTDSENPVVTEKNFVDVWLARVLDKTEHTSVIGYNPRQFGSETTTAIYRKDGTVQDKYYKKEYGLLISETPATASNEWKTVIYSFKTYDFDNDTGKYSNSANSKNSDWDELGLVFAGSADLEIDNIRIAKKADLPTISVKDSSGEEVETYIGFTGTELAQGFCTKEYISMYQKIYCTDNTYVNKNVVFGTNEEAYLKNGTLQISDFVSEKSSYYNNNYFVSGHTSSSWSHNRWGIVSGNTIDADSNGMLKYHYTYNTTSNSKFGTAAGKDGKIATGTSVISVSKQRHQLLPNTKYILQLDYYIEDIDITSDTTTPNMILLANRVSGENGVNDTTKRNLDNSDTCTTSGYESSAIFVETEKSSEWKTITYEFTTHNWTNDTTGDSATDNILVLLMRGYGTAYIDNIKLAIVSDNALLNSVATVNLISPDNDETLDSIYGFPGDLFDSDIFSLNNKSILGLYTDKTFIDKFNSEVLVEGTTNLYPKTYLNINDFTSNNSQYNIGGLKLENQYGSKFNHLRWGISDEQIAGVSNSMLKYKYSYATETVNKVGSAAGSSGASAVAVAVLSDSNEFFELSPNTTYRLEFDYFIKNIDTTSDAKVNELVIRADRAIDHAQTGERRILESYETVAGAKNLYDTELVSASSVSESWQNVSYNFTTYDWTKEDAPEGNGDWKNLVLQISGYGEVFIDNIKIIDEHNGAAVNLYDSDAVIDKLVGFPGEELVITDPVKENSYFQGWYTDNEFADKFVETTYAGTGTVTNLYAKWDLLGDVNGDNKVNIIDLVRIKKYIADPDNTVISVDNANIIPDEIADKIDAQDLSALRQILLGIKNF